MRILVPLVLLALAAQNSTVIPDFSRYTQSEAFQYFVRMQTDAEHHSRESNLLAISEFSMGRNIALQYTVKQGGLAINTRHVHNWALQASGRKQLSSADLNNLLSAIRELPSENTIPPVFERLVIVSFREGSNWVTRSYDALALPPAMRRIYDIIGERSESINFRTQALNPR